ncbi:hypothetical protein POL68_08430 [Stigmatella sp. ncwal1]|uniref:Uncharacterized protein n=1 Tax=Stigmatella ashevillensis TaxID=2995309 RepID=A0ABT5D493_9BACT|nr:hypothetical protein [Stigmatella ashevillena]MDC0708492.1 hypothetical protein [Stigmatella ashevillena]
MFTRAATLRRCTAMLLAVLWALPLLVAMGHSEEHAHRFCAEHQAFEETARGTGQLLSQFAPQVPLLSASRLAEALDTSRLTHDTCPVLTAGTGQELLLPELLWTLTACMSVSLPATAPSRPTVSVPILAIAPKSSPPARA